MLKKIFSIVFCLLLAACNQTEAEIESLTPGDLSAANFTMTEVAAHSVETDCWMVLQGKVYDITKHIPKHPGGKKIIESCGKDVTEIFYPPADSGISRHMRVEDSLLAEYFIGNLTP
ncbi:cytochrome b5 domain-containing protein [Candidatus Gracilibacteria bacterium]|nr:cytochrome b5 domain-containing protein [Candidatus Gracilibacteria bacterium]MCF7856065.1 cytochrome b5 domain-containing protein [Candidatus Gracilibacteria bacterium]MCF7896380.1 cytochrome b5 domain-containing protein [Candidatus Gracilibacteria bacterium]